MYVVFSMLLSLVANAPRRAALKVLSPKKLWTATDHRMKWRRKKVPYSLRRTPFRFAMGYS